jgi:hypothetical protein
VIPANKLLENASPPELAATAGTRIIASAILKHITAAILFRLKSYFGDSCIFDLENM